MMINKKMNRKKKKIIAHDKKIEKKNKTLRTQLTKIFYSKLKRKISRKIFNINQQKFEVFQEN